MSDDLDAREEAVLEALSPRFLKALDLKERGRHDDAVDELLAILRIEPRLPEPHMELARMMLEADRTDEAEAHAREALEHLERSGAWTDDLPEEVVRALAHATLAEVLRRRADEDDVIFGDPEAFHALLAEARTNFEKAAELDPSDAYSSWHAFFMGAPSQGAAQREAREPDVADDIIDADEILPET